jgi:hypothetical protein
MFIRTALVTRVRLPVFTDGVLAAPADFSVIRPNAVIDAAGLAEAKALTGLASASGSSERTLLARTLAERPSLEARRLASEAAPITARNNVGMIQFIGARC